MVVLETTGEQMTTPEQAKECKRCLGHGRIPTNAGVIYRCEEFGACPADSPAPYLGTDHPWELLDEEVWESRFGLFARKPVSKY